MRHRPLAPAVMIVRGGVDVAAPAARAYDLYADYRNWPALFPAINAVRETGRDGDAVELAIEHREGSVTNRLRLEPPARIVVTERKRRYDAEFVNTFRDTPTGSRYEVVGEVRLRGWLRPLAPIIRPYARRQLRRLTLAPMKAAAEARRGGPE
ncbi:SRPBCC family protein [Plantactinospora siamensis]|uniref:SRPBCC family protein n=1 Tax=Plantactinospora siamensis TaxID=555372 RepID=A0ABV6P405_9ACTN